MPWVGKTKDINVANSTLKYRLGSLWALARNLALKIYNVRNVHCRFSKKKHIGTIWHRYKRILKTQNRSEICKNKIDIFENIEIETIFIFDIDNKIETRINFSIFMRDETIFFKISSRLVSVHHYSDPSHKNAYCKEAIHFLDLKKFLGSHRSVF